MGWSWARCWERAAMGAFSAAFGTGSASLSRCASCLCGSSALLQSVHACAVRTEPLCCLQAKDLYQHA